MARKSGSAILTWHTSENLKGGNITPPRLEREKCSVPAVLRKQNSRLAAVRKQVKGKEKKIIITPIISIYSKQKAQEMLLTEENKQ